MKNFIYIISATVIFTSMTSCQKDVDFVEEEVIIVNGEEEETTATTTTTTTTTEESTTTNGNGTTTGTTTKTETTETVETTEETTETVSENHFTLKSEGNYQINPFFIGLTNKHNNLEIYFHGSTWGTSQGGSIKFPKNATSGTYIINPRGSVAGTTIRNGEVAIEIGNYTHQNIAQSGIVELIVEEKQTQVIFKNIPTIRSNNAYLNDEISGIFTVITKL